MISTPKDPQQVDHQQPLESSTELSSHTQTRLVAALIILATLNALIWSFVRVPALGGPDEFDHFKIVQNIVTSGSLAVFEGYGPGAYASGPIRAQVAHEITPNAFAIPVAAVISLIGSSEYPGYYFKFFHVALDPNLTDGSTVQAGQQIGTIGDEESWGEIAVQVRIGINDNRLVSFLEVASDQVLLEYKDRGVNVVTDVIVSRGQRDANPLSCDDSEAGWFIGSGREGVPLDEEFLIWQFESSDNWFFFD